MKETLLIFHLIIFVLGNLNGQVSNELITSPSQEQATKVKENSSKLFFLVTESFPLKGNGRKFLTTNFIESTLIDFQGETFEVELRYRFADDEMQIIHQGKNKALFPQKVRKLIFKKYDSEQIFVSVEYSSKETVNFGYFELLAEGKVKLLKQYQKSEKDEIETNLFLQTEGNLVEDFKVKKSSLKKLMKAHKSEILKFIAKNKLDIDKEDDLKKVFDYYNSLP
jgi:hypothetical protein